MKDKECLQKAVFTQPVKGGADAVYLGLKQFNGRGRASNFNNFQLLSIVEIAKAKGVQVYVTLNIVVKNNELPQLIDYLYFLFQAGVDAIIIQDWGVYYLAKKYFPKLNIHASTQLGIHNSSGTIHSGFKRKILAKLSTKLNLNKTEIYYRINSLEWLRKIHLNEMDGLFLTLSKTLWNRFNPDLPFIQKFRNKIYIELPKFISEDSIEFYQKLAERMAKAGLKKFVLSHLSQIEIIPKNCSVFTNENVYVFNNATSAILKEQNIKCFTYPLEIDFMTLNTFSHKTGIVLVYFYPELFHSRMPVKAGNEDQFKDDSEVELRRFRRNGITSVVPKNPVSWLQFKIKIAKSGFSRFLIDLSYEGPSKSKAKTIKSHLLRSEQVQPSTSFNFSKELK